jgi:hypothetical protein
MRRRPSRFFDAALQAAKTLIKFLTAPDAAPVFKAKGLEPAS